MNEFYELNYSHCRIIKSVFYAWFALKCFDFISS